MSATNQDKEKIRVFIVEDSPVALNILSRILQSSQKIEVVGTATNGMTALKQIPRLKPQVICTDLVMSKMDGWEFTKQLMATFPLPILVISDSSQTEDAAKVARLKDLGVLDVFPKPATGFIQDYERQSAALIAKIKILAGVKVFTKRNSSKPEQNLSRLAIATPAPTKPVSYHQYQIIGIGMSTGGPKAIEDIVSQLPPNFPVPIVCTQHISIGFLNSFIASLNSATSLTVKVASIGELPQPGTVYFAPENYHLEIDESGKFVYSAADPIDSHRPSITIMLKSLARYYGNSAMGILLTGMGRDGVAGMTAIWQKGGMTIAQDEASSIIFGMPKEAISLGVVRKILPLSKIAPFLLSQVGESLTI